MLGGVSVPTLPAFQLRSSAASQLSQTRISPVVQNFAVRVTRCLTKRLSNQPDQLTMVVGYCFLLLPVQGNSALFYCDELSKKLFDPCLGCVADASKIAPLI